MKIDKRSIAKALIEFGEKLRKLDSKKEGHFTPNLEADRLVWNDPLVFLFGVILDQGLKAEKVWETPYLLKQRLGQNGFENKKACKLLLEKYEGKAENIWNDNPRTEDLQRRFEEFDGIGQKKASMATNILVMDFGINVKDKRGIDLSYDRHVRRVFLRTGLVEKDDMNLMIKTARRLNPEYPGALDYLAWIIEREYCHPQNPKCDKCPISKVCPKLLDVPSPETV